MRSLFTKDMHTILAGQAVSGIAGRAQTLQVQRGRVWVTVEGIAHDYFLHAGETFTAIPGRLIVVEADRDSHVKLPRATVPHPLRNVRAWLFAIVRRMTHTGTVHAGLKRHRACESC